MLAKTIQGFTKTVNRISLLAGQIGGICIFVIMVVVSIEVFGRTFFDVSTMICDEISGYLNAAIIFLGLAYTLGAKGFLRVEFVYDRFKGGFLRFIKWMNVLLGFVYVVILNIYLWRHVLYSYNKKVISIYFTETPLYIPQAIVGLGALILGLQLVAYLLNRVRNIP